MAYATILCRLTREEFCFRTGRSASFAVQEASSICLVPPPHPTPPPLFCSVRSSASQERCLVGRHTKHRTQKVLSPSWIFLGLTWNSFRAQKHIIWGGGFLQLLGTKKTRVFFLARSWVQVLRFKRAWFHDKQAQYGCAFVEAR